VEKVTDRQNDSDMHPPTEETFPFWSSKHSFRQVKELQLWIFD